MFAAVGNHVEELRRLSIGGLNLDQQLKPKEWKYLTESEIDQLMNRI